MSVIGTEVPIPGGAMQALDELELTTPDDARSTVQISEAAFARAGQSDAFSRVIAVVVQPGVEFGSHNVVDYNSTKAQALSATLKDLPGLVFEAHSTDYQTRANLTDLVKDGFAILKVGPALTFVLREALYGLDAIAEELFPGSRDETLRATMERIMLAAPENWVKYYEGSDAELALQRPRREDVQPRAAARRHHRDVGRLIRDRAVHDRDDRAHGRVDGFSAGFAGVGGAGPGRGGGAGRPGRAVDRADQDGAGDRAGGRAQGAPGGMTSMTRSAATGPTRATGRGRRWC